MDEIYSRQVDVRFFLLRTDMDEIETNHLSKLGVTFIVVAFAKELVVIVGGNSRSESEDGTPVIAALLFTGNDLRP